MKKYLFLSGFIYFLFPQINAQHFTGAATYYNDSFAEWRFFTDMEEEEGALRLRWEGDWSEWDYRLGEIFGTIKMKWKDKPGEWELRANNKIVTARTIWSNDFTEWRIRGGGKSFTLRSKWKNRLDVWEIKNSEYGDFVMETHWEGDPRDWNIFDTLNEEVDFETKMMMMFIVLFSSSPKQ